MKKFGPALLVTAAFIGPGTVTTATLAGGNYGFALVWALIFSVIATFVLQEMASRLGLVTGRGLAEAITEQFSGIKRLLAVFLVISAIGIGNAAYQGGNLTGAALGLSGLAGGKLVHWVWLLAAISSALLLSGKYKLVEKALIGLVLTMSTVFIATMFIAGPDLIEILKGAFSFALPSGSSLMVIALIGTTVVPYNLFLHASIVANNRQDNQDLPSAMKNNRIDTTLSIGLGGFITLSILSCAATAFFATQTEVQAHNIGQQLTPLLGNYANIFFAIGLFSAGLTSAITAPLAAAYAVSGALGWQPDLSNKKFKTIWITVMLAGITFASIGIKPLAAILFAQAANGLLLPVIAIFLIWTLNNKSLMGNQTNGFLANLFGGLIVAFVSTLGLYKVVSLFF
ncbi:Nramp family divalent metal transporter [Aliiglaciecola lipolytica]|uniref:Natural resistance-associated macrophage protein n=1 Tax=Aliiglaciecola lipolytica E3 TaxID=1127673 RepID=K6YII8_9ALTE|nr:Nramp family divalent metal transporter [Aliiglaciecola lipolytica]GAC16413.1 natural resistance-associated macrophage protein [Aliiglaciecola lipolytica E3]